MKHSHLNPLSAPPSRDPEEDAQRQVRAPLRRPIKLMIFGRRTFAVAVISIFLGCESTNYVPPPVTGEMAKTGHVRHGTNPSDWRIDVAKLREGRTLFVSRCIECHALPSIAAHTTAEWPRLIDEMADRANLKRAEREALVGYIVAARGQTR